MKKYIFPILTIIWMLVIFSFSAENGTQSEDTSNKIVKPSIEIVYGDKFEQFDEEKQESILSKFSLVIRKSAHFTEYGILATLLFFSFFFFNKSKIGYFYSLLLTFFYAQTDELHQMIVGGRTGCFKDVLIDTSGGLCFLLIIFIIMLIIYKKKVKKVYEN